MDQYLEAALIAAMLAAICYLTGGLVDALLNPFWVLITEFSLMRNALRAPLWQGRATYIVIAPLVSSCWYGFERNRKSNRMAVDL